MTKTPTAQPEEIPCNCETCTNEDCDLSNHALKEARENRIHDVGRIMIMRCTTKMHGCLSHTGARAYLNKDVIAELERRLEVARSIPRNGFRVVALKEAIALLRGDGK